MGRVQTMLEVGLSNARWKCGCRLAVFELENVVLSCYESKEPRWCAECTFEF